MTRPWLFIDANYLCHRAYHSHRQLSHQNMQTGMLYGVLRDIITLRDLHLTDRFAFCFDLGRSLRCGVYEAYKGNRHRDQTPEERMVFKELRQQISLLRTDYLPDLGFKNVFAEPGYEADDLIASLCLNLREDRRAIIVSADHDLFQLLAPNVCVWSPARKHAVTHTSFEAEFGVTPRQWITVKAIAGCKSDNLPGVVGVGEKTAAKYLNGSLVATSKLYQKIRDCRPLWKVTKKLVRLPFPGTPVYKLQRDQVDQKAWTRLTDRLGMQSLRDIVFSN